MYAKSGTVRCRAGGLRESNSNLRVNWQLMSRQFSSQIQCERVLFPFRPLSYERRLVKCSACSREVCTAVSSIPGFARIQAYQGESAHHLELFFLPLQCHDYSSSKKNRFQMTSFSLSRPWSNSLKSRTSTASPRQ